MKTVTIEGHEYNAPPVARTINDIKRYEVPAESYTRYRKDLSSRIWLSKLTDCKEYKPR